MRPKIDEQSASAALAGHDGFALITNQKLRDLYTAMVRCRRLAEQQDKRLGEVAGQEAAVVGVCIDLDAKDWIATSASGLMGRFVQGAPLADFFTLTEASEAQLDLALGRALSYKTKQNGKVVVVFGGAGAATEWKDALCAAGEHQLPILFVRWSSSLPEEKSGKRSLKAEINIPGEVPVIPVDGSDVVAVYRVATESIAHARRGNGPTLIDCLPYCIEGERKKDPLSKMEAYLSHKGLFDRKLKNEAEADFSRELDVLQETGEKRRKLTTR